MKLDLKIIISVIHWGIFFGLCALSILSMREVLEKFQSKDSSFTQYEEPITEHPTTVMCFSPPFKNRTDPDLPLPQLTEKQFEIGIDFNISFSTFGDKTYNWKDGMNSYENDDTLISLNMEKLTSLYHGNCYKMTPNVTTSKMNVVWILMETSFDKSIPKEILPSVEIFQSSEENSYGVILDSWADGKVFALYAEKNTDFFPIIQPEKYIYDQSKTKCRIESFYECYTSVIVSTNFEWDGNCSSKCFPAALPNLDKLDIPICKTIEDLKCNYHLLDKYLDEITIDMCPKACSVLQYSETVIMGDRHKMYRPNGSDYLRRFSYHLGKLQNVIVHKEYLIYDFIGVIGSAGGTLGLFIGFSFINIIDSIVSFLKTKTS